MKELRSVSTHAQANSLHFFWQLKVRKHAPVLFWYEKVELTSNFFSA